MPTNLFENATFDDPIAVPIDADPGNAASVQVPFQGLANRTRNLKGRIDLLDPDGSGVRQLRVVADYNALRAVPAGQRTQGQIVQITGKGIFEWDAASTATALEPYVVRPNDIGPASPGRWVISFNDARATPGGLATLDVNTKLRPEQTPNRLIGIYEQYFGALSFPITSGYASSQVDYRNPFFDGSGVFHTSYPTVTYLSDPQVGDVLSIDVSAVLYVVFGGSGAIGLEIYDGGFLFYPSHFQAAVNVNVPWQHVTMTGKYTLQHGNVVYFAMRMAAYGSSSTYFYLMYPFSMRIRHERP